jgi:hypothetical protein
MPVSIGEWGGAKTPFTPPPGSVTASEFRGSWMKSGPRDRPLLELCGFVVDGKVIGRRPPISVNGMENLLRGEDDKPCPTSDAGSLERHPLLLLAARLSSLPVKLLKWKTLLTRAQTCIMFVTTIAVEASLVYQKIQMGLKGCVKE